MNAFFALNKKLADSSWFQNFILATILMAGVLVGIQTYRAEIVDIVDILDTIDLIILIIFTVEVFVKIFAEGKKPWNYFKDAWNIFDFLIVAVCYLAFILPSIDASFVAVLRLARVLRVFKLVTAIPKLQLLVGALLKSIPSMGYVGILLILLFYIYAAMGVFLYGENDPIHFGNLHMAMLSLFRIVTLEDWTDVMYIAMYGCDNYGYDGNEDLCVNPSASPLGGAIFFVSFVLIGTMIVLNLFIGVIMTSMDEAKAEAEAMDRESQGLDAEVLGVEDNVKALTEKVDGLQGDIKELTKLLREKGN